MKPVYKQMYGAWWVQLTPSHRFTVVKPEDVPAEEFAKYDEVKPAHSVSSSGSVSAKITRAN